MLIALRPKFALFITDQDLREDIHTFGLASCSSGMPRAGAVAAVSRHFERHPLLGGGDLTAWLGMEDSNWQIRPRASRPRFGGTFFYRHPRDTIYGNVMGAGHSGPAGYPLEALSPASAGLFLRSSSPRHPLPLIEVWLLTHPPHIAGPHTRADKSAPSHLDGADGGAL